MNRDLAPQRIKSAVAVALLHVLMGYAFITGLGVEMIRETGERLTLIDIVEPVPPPPVEEPVPAKAVSSADEGRAAPENLKARPTQIVARPPEITVPTVPPITSAPVAGTGSESDAGASDRPGPGTGAGGIGTGTGSGGAGSGTGSGGGSEARLVRGRIVHADYPRAAVRARAEGTVVARLNVGADGRVASCTVTRSSGSPDLDSTTCRLIQQRFRFTPARDNQGRAIASVTGWQQRWWLESD
ncbi:MAG TPA: TonB family protein [Allosphingosinicella sp.]|nr:TonB family protein [Allosphingosinicella sp.]